MDYRTYSHRLEYLKELIQKGQLSSPNDLTRDFECSEKTIRKMINELRNNGIKIKYSRADFKCFIESE